MTQPKFAIAITADDKTAKGAASAEKRLGKIPKHVSSVNRAQERALRDTVGRNSRGVLRTLGEVERASARVFGNRSVTSGFATRLGAMREAASAAGSGLGAVAEAGGAAEGALLGLGAVAGATVGVLAAAGYAAFKLADGWAKGAASIGRTSDLIGIATKDMQEFAAAAERVGVDKGVAVGTLGSMSDALNGAAYGTNGTARGVLNKLGVKIIRKADGSVDIGAMLPSIADAIARQNPYGARVAGNALGISDAALAAFRQGGKALAADMADAGKTAYIATPSDIARGKRIARKGAMIGQLGERASAIAGSAAADLAEPGYDAVLSGGRQILGGATTFGGVVKNIFAPGASAIERGGRSIERAAGQISGSAGYSKGGRVSGLVNGRLYISPTDRMNLKKGLATEVSANAPGSLMGATLQVMLNRMASGRWGTTAADVLNANKQFSDINGPVAWRRGRHSVEEIPMSRVPGTTGKFVDWYIDQYLAKGGKSIIGDALNYANPYTSDPVNRGPNGWITKMSGVTIGKGRAVHKFGTAPGYEDYRPGSFKTQTDPVPVKVEIEMRGAPQGTKAKVTAGRSSTPAVSYAFSPVHGG